MHYVLLFVIVSAHLFILDTTQTKGGETSTKMYLVSMESDSTRSQGSHSNNESH